MEWIVICFLLRRWFDCIRFFAYWRFIFFIWEWRTSTMDQRKKDCLPFDDESARLSVDWWCRSASINKKRHEECNEWSLIYLFDSSRIQNSLVDDVVPMSNWMKWHPVLENSSLFTLNSLLKTNTCRSCMIQRWSILIQCWQWYWTNCTFSWIAKKEMSISWWCSCSTISQTIENISRLSRNGLN